MGDSVLRALAEPRQRDTLRLVYEQERSSGEIAARFNITTAAISQPLRVLESGGLVSVRKDGRRRLYRPRPEGLLELRSYLEAFWVDRLIQLKDAAESEGKGEQLGDQSD